MGIRERLELARQQMAYNWPYYGPRIVGGALVLLILVLGFLFWRSTRRQDQVAQETNRLALLPSPTPAPIGGTPEAVATPTPTQAPEAGAVTKGGQPVEKLPDTGFPLVFAIPALVGAGAAGLKLARFRK